MVKMNRELLKELSEVDIETVNKNELVDANEIILDYSIPQVQRIDYLLAKLKNPYCFKVGEIAVKIGFNENGKSFEDAFLAILKREKNSL
jgi:hypothetical protein